MKRIHAAAGLFLAAMLHSTYASDIVALGTGKQPQAAVDPAGNVFVVYGSGPEIYCRASTDAGKTFGDAVLVGKADNMPLGMRRGPRVAAADASVVVTAISGEKGGGKDGDVVSWRSTDKGKTWTKAAKPVNSVPGAAREGLQSVAAGHDEKFFCVWLDLRNSKTEIWGAASTDGGQTWGKDALIYKSPDGGTCPCCHPSVAFDAKGTLTVMFRNDLKGEKDIYATRSTDGGKTFSAAGKMGAGAWKLQACPMDGGSLAGAADGSLMTIWRRQKNVFTAAPGKPERDLGAGEQPSIAAGPGGAYALWIQGRPGALMLLAPNATAAKIADGALDPVIAADIDGKGPVVATWASSNAVQASVIKARN